MRRNKLRKTKTVKEILARTIAFLFLLTIFRTFYFPFAYKLALRPQAFSIDCKRSSLSESRCNIKGLNYFGKYNKSFSVDKLKSIEVKSNNDNRNYYAELNISDEKLYFPFSYNPYDTEVIFKDFLNNKTNSIKILAGFSQYLDAVFYFLFITLFNIVAVYFLIVPLLPNWILERLTN